MPLSQNDIEPVQQQGLVSQGLIINQSDNSQIPGQPEYGKPWKPQFNHGCCPSCGDQEQPVCTTKIQAFTRYNQDPSLVTVITTSGRCPCQDESPVSGCEGTPPDSLDCSSISA